MFGICTYVTRTPSSTRAPVLDSPLPQRKFQRATPWPVAYELSGIGLDGSLKLFRKPWFMTSLPFISMWCCLPIAIFEERAAAKRALVAGSDQEQPLLPSSDSTMAGAGTAGSPEKPRTSEWKQAALLAIPTSCDIIATALMNTGLLSVTASVYQMMRGAEMIFAAVLAVLFLRRRLNRGHYGGIASCTAGIALVGVASILADEGGTKVAVSQWDVFVGMALIVLSQLVQAVQITFEDFAISELSIPPLKIVGYEGVIGSVLMYGVMLPLVYFLPGPDGSGIHEDTLDTFTMLASSPTLCAAILAQCIGLLGYNVGGMSVTGLLGAVFRTVLETVRTLFVWVAGVGLFYAGTGLGERLSLWSPVQALGFGVLVAGTMVYGHGDELEAQRVIAELVAEEEAQVPEGEVRARAALRPLPAPYAVPAAGGGLASSFTFVRPSDGAGGLPEPGGASPGRPLMIVPPQSASWNAGFSMAAGSYHEALATSLRSAGFMGSQDLQG